MYSKLSRFSFANLIIFYLHLNMAIFLTNTCLNHLFINPSIELLFHSPFATPHRFAANIPTPRPATCETHTNTISLPLTISTRYDIPTACRHAWEGVCALLDVFRNVCAIPVLQSTGSVHWNGISYLLHWPLALGTYTISSVFTLRIILIY